MKVLHISSCMKQPVEFQGSVCKTNTCQPVTNEEGKMHMENKALQESNQKQAKN